MLRAFVVTTAYAHARVDGWCVLDVPLTLREIQAEDAAFLVSMLAVAADWRKGTVVREPSEVMASPDLAKYAAGWPQAGDRGLVAVTDDGQRLGAAWWRFLGPPTPGYGFVS